MHQSTRRIAAALLAVGIGTAAARDARAQIGGAARKFPDAGGQILIFTDELPGQPTDAQWQFIASHYVGTQKELLSWTQHVRQLNPNFLMLHYQLALGNGPAQFIDGNSWTNDFPAVSANESWFLHDTQGHRLEQTAWDWFVMNITFANNRPQSGYPNYWVTSALKRLRDNQNDGVFADSYTPDALFGQEEPAYSWFNDVNSCLAFWIPNPNQFGAYCARALHSQPEKFYYLPNLGALVTYWDKTNYAVGDGGMIEGFAIPGSTSTYNTGDWQLQIGRALSLSAQGKIVICQSYIDSSNRDERWFVVGSHLLMKGHYSYLNMFQNNSLEWYPEYNVPLGAYLAEPVANLANYWDASWNVYRRDFVNGFVLVNPGTTAVTVNLGGAYHLVAATGGGAVGANGVASGSLSTSVVTSVTIPAHSARVLLH
jgi:hypothetical protein